MPIAADLPARPRHLVMGIRSNQRAIARCDYGMCIPAGQLPGQYIFPQLQPQRARPFVARLDTRAFQ